MLAYSLLVIVLGIYFGQQPRDIRSNETLRRNVERDTYLKNFRDTKAKFKAAKLMQLDSTKLDQLKTELRVLEKKVNETGRSCDVAPAKYHEEPFKDRLMNMFSQASNFTRQISLQASNLFWLVYHQATEHMTQTSNIKEDQSRLEDKLDELQSTIESLNNHIKKLADPL